jgi:hypothetical protein
MCAKKAAITTGKSAATGRKSSRNGNAATGSATRAAAPSERTLSPTDIGAVAGEIWVLLSGTNAQTLSAIKKSLSAPPDVVVAGIGWLAREDKLEFTMSGRTVKLSLKR